MDGQTLSFASYWRNSLADAEFGKGAFTRSEGDDFTLWSATAIASGKLERQYIDQFFADEADNIDYVDIILRPKVFLRLVEHTKERTTGAPGIITPLIFGAKLSRTGYIFPLDDAQIPRDLLEPLPKGTFSIGNIDQLDHYKTLNKPLNIAVEEIEIDDEEETSRRKEKHQQQWRDFCTLNDQLLNAVAGEWLNNPEQYLIAHHGYIIKKEPSNGASRHILALYDHLIASKPNLPLFNRFSAQVPEVLKELLPSGAKFADRLGHSGDKFSLAPAQRDALSHMLNGENGDILAINGPPGTGKTTLVLSIIATLWARAALNKSEPPVVLAISTNNQAVTNIIEAFGKDFSPGQGVMAGRWLPGIHSFGAYFPAATRKSEANNKYQTEDFFDKIENRSYLEAAEAYYLEKSKEAFPQLSRHTIESVTEKLHQQLKCNADNLASISSDWEALTLARAQCLAIADDIHIYREKILSALTQQQVQLENIRDALTTWHDFISKESIFYALLGWLPAIRKQRRSRIIQKVNPSLDKIKPAVSWSEPLQIEPLLEKAVTDVNEAISIHRLHLEQIDKVIFQEQQAFERWQFRAEELGAKKGAELTFSYIDQLADTAIRYPIFQLTTHYWEGRWLIDMFNITDINSEKTKTGRKVVIPRWYRRMKLTPCIVSTCFMLPDKMKISEFKGQKRFEDNYLYDFADLLIVDEAGQVLPEVAAASFSLAKQALIIGDNEQIAPIWNMTPTIDIGNMLSCKLLNANNQQDLHDQYSAISQMGKSAATGSVMKVAQAASRYHYDTQLTRGMYLYEHRRCYDEIINYCNDLCYQGKLQPLRGAEKNNHFPAMGYLHIDGIGVKASGGSRHNLMEAETIASWLVKHQAQITEKYGKPIHEIVGIVTPFGAQVATIKNAIIHHQLQAADDSDNAITVGTVHALQGAERPIIIFSSVYSKHQDGSFIDRDNTMLNVAVSRAKDSFLVFGDMDLFEGLSRSVPRGLLAHYLFADENNRLHFALPERSDLKTKATLEVLQGVEQHDAFLLAVCIEAQRSLTIVSPWLIWQKLEQTGFLEAMKEACRRGVEVNVITDQGFNRDRQTDTQLQSIFDQLINFGIRPHLVNRVHSKVVMSDDVLLCVGSYNWFSAAREGHYARYDTSLLYRGKNLVKEIHTIRHSLEQRMI